MEIEENEKQSTVTSPNIPTSLDITHTFLFSSYIPEYQQDSVTLEHIFSLYFSQNSLFYSNYHQKLLHFNFQTHNIWHLHDNNQKICRNISYGFYEEKNDESKDEERSCDEEQVIRLEKDENTDIWLHLHLFINTIVYENVKKENILMSIPWNMVWTITKESLQVRIYSEIPMNEIMNHICNVTILTSEISDMIPLLPQLDDSSDDWFQLISCSTSVLSEESKVTRVSGDFKTFAQNLIDQNTSMIEITSPEEIGPDENSILESLSGDVTTFESCLLKKHECIFFSIKLGINFQTQNNKIVISNIDFSEITDDFSSIHCLDSTCIDSIYGNAIIEDNTYLRGLNLTIDRRPSRITLVLRKQPQSTVFVVPDVITREVASQERFWRIGVDTNQPTYKISAAPVKRASASIQVHSDSSSPVAAIAAAQYAAPIACDTSDPRSPGSRTPIVTATVVASRPLEVFY